MDTRVLTSTEFRNFLGRSMQGFFEDWALQRSVDPEVFGEAMTARDWLEMFSEFAVAEIVNPPVARAAS